MGAPSDLQLNALQGCSLPEIHLHHVAYEAL